MGFLNFLLGGLGFFFFFFLQSMCSECDQFSNEEVTERFWRLNVFSVTSFPTQGLLESSEKAPVSVACGSESPLDGICLSESDKSAVLTLIREEVKAFWFCLRVTLFFWKARVPPQWIASLLALITQAIHITHIKALSEAQH